MKYTIWITGKCNMNCNYCYEREKEERQMSMDVAEEVASRIGNSKNVFNVHFHGGEVFTNLPVLFYLATEFSNKGIHTDITTNGTLIDNEKAKKIIRLVDSIAISIDGDKDVYEKNRKLKRSESVFEKVIDNAKMLLREKPDAIARMTVAPNNFEKLDTSILFLAEMGFKRITYALDYTNAEWNKSRIDSLCQKLREVGLIKGKLNSYGISVEGPGNGIPHTLTRCNGGISRLDVYMDGSFYPCTAVAGEKAFCIGDIRNGIKVDWADSLQNINSHKMQARCEKCINKEKCRASKCRFINQCISGSLYMPSEVVCYVNKRLLANSCYV